MSNLDINSNEDSIVNLFHSKVGISVNLDYETKESIIHEVYTEDSTTNAEILFIEGLAVLPNYSLSPPLFSRFFLQVLQGVDEDIDFDVLCEDLTQKGWLEHSEGRYKLKPQLWDFLQGRVANTDEYKGLIRSCENFYFEVKEAFLNNQPIECDINPLDMLDRLAIYAGSNAEGAVYARLNAVLGIVYLHLKNYEAAYGYYTYATEQYEHIYGVDHPSAVDMYSTLIDICNNMDNFEEAVTFMEKKIGILQTRRCETMGMEYDFLANLCTKNEDAKGAIIAYEKALAAFTRETGTESESTAITAYNLALQYKKCDAHKEALMYYEESERIYTVLFGEDYSCGPIAYSNMAYLYRILGKLEKSVEYYLKSIPLYEKEYGREHENTFRDINNLGVAYDAMGEHEKALAQYQEAVVLYEKAYGEEHEETSRIYRNIGNELKELEHYELALDYYKKALSIDLKTLGETYYTAVTYHHMAAAYWRLEDREKALECYETSLNIKEKTVGSEDKSIADTYYNMAGIYVELNQLHKAVVYYEKIIYIEEKLLTSNDMELTLAYLRAADIYLALNDVQSGLKYYHQSLDIYLHNLGEEDPNIAYIKNRIGIIYGNMRKFDEALNYCCEAYNIIEKHQPEMEEMLGVVGENIKNLTSHIQKA